MSKHKKTLAHLSITSFVTSLPAGQQETKRLMGGGTVPSEGICSLPTGVELCPSEEKGSCCSNTSQKSIDNEHI